MELSGRVITILILTGMVLGIFFDTPKRKKKPSKKAAPEPTPGQKLAKLIEQYVDSGMGNP